jgi:hypothetical protein
MSMLADGIESIKGRRAAVLNRRWLYYRGDQPRIWVTSKFSTRFRDLADSMGDNYCELAVNSRLNRLEVTGWNGDGAQAAEDLWAGQRWPLRQADFFRWGLAYGTAYLIVGEDDGNPVMAPNRPVMVWHSPVDDDPSRVDFAVKLWRAGGLWRATVYDQEQTVRYVSRDGSVRKVPGVETFALDDDDPGGPHGFDGCPVVAVEPYGSDAPVMLDTIRGPQDRINKIAANKFVAAEFSAYAQRVFFTRQSLDQKDVANQPDWAIILDPGDETAKASVQELMGGDLSKFDAAKQEEINGLFTLATLPRHLMVNPGVAPSGEAIKADEGPFVEAVENHQVYYGAALSDGLRLLGIDAEPAWRTPEVSSDLSEGETVRTYTDAGIPWQFAVRRYAGWSEDDVTEATAGAPAIPPAAGAVNPFGAALLAGAPPANGAAP